MLHHRRGTRGAASVEYGLLIGGIAALIVAVAFFFGGRVVGIFDNTSSCAPSNGSTCSISAPASPAPTS